MEVSTVQRCHSASVIYVQGKLRGYPVRFFLTGIQASEVASPAKEQSPSCTCLLVF